jgi:hypothetical protein
MVLADDCGIAADAKTLPGARFDRSGQGGWTPAVLNMVWLFGSIIGMGHCRDRKIKRFL